jgi:SAM-dependent methyltransferase
MPRAASNVASMTTDNWAERRTSFGSAALDYAAGRPSYPIEALRWALPADARTVLDLAAGTGKLTERLLELGLDVHAVEPLAEMRAVIPTTAHAIEGTAEAIPLPDASVDGVTVGQAYHWFDAPLALAEMRRVLRPGGAIGLFWNLLDDSVGWVGDFLESVAGEERASAISADPQPIWTGVDGLTEPERGIFRHAAAYDADRLVAYVVSRSQTILLPTDERAALVERVRAIAPAGEFELPLVCEAWRGVKT